MKYILLFSPNVSNTVLLLVFQQPKAQGKPVTDMFVEGFTCATLL